MTSDPAVTAVRAVISGRVQGVWFRGWIRERAGELGLDGWVRNRRDGTVEAVFAGSEAAVAEMLAACRKGPPLARVTEIATTTADTPPAAGFETRPTA